MQSLGERLKSKQQSQAADCARAEAVYLWGQLLTQKYLRYRAAKRCGKLGGGTIHHRAGTSERCVVVATYSRALDFLKPFWSSTAKHCHGARFCADSILEYMDSVHWPPRTETQSSGLYWCSKRCLESKQARLL